MKTPRAPKAVVSAERDWADALVRSLAARPLAVQSICVAAVYLDEKKSEARHRRRAKAVRLAWNKLVAASDAAGAPAPEPSR